MNAMPPPPQPTPSPLSPEISPELESWAKAWFQAGQLDFPADFRWGTATSAHQVEGNNTHNQWWAFEQIPGAIWHGDRSGWACDWWRHVESDLDRMATLHQNAHRLSVEWSRIEPEPGRFDHSALDRYREILGGLQDRGMEPLVTLHHFTNPLWLERRGGWEDGSAVALFRRFVEITVQALGDLCSFWCTINEPMVYVAQGWFLGQWPPRRSHFPTAMRVTRHLLFAHAEAYHAIHRIQPDALVGYAKHVRLFQGLRPGHPLDRCAAGLKRWLFEHLWVAATSDGVLRPPLAGFERDPRLVGTRDYFGVNYYTQDRTRFTPNPLRLFGVEEFPPHAEQTDPGRDGRPFAAFAPEGLYQVCQELQHHAPGVPIYITENGVPDREDRLRPRWLVAHLQQLHRAIQDGCHVRGYYHWTLVDNFEWAEGWGLRFGLFALDPTTQERTARPSAYLYREIARRNAVPRNLEVPPPGP